MLPFPSLVSQRTTDVLRGELLNHTQAWAGICKHSGLEKWCMRSPALMCHAFAMRLTCLACSAVWEESHSLETYIDLSTQIHSQMHDQPQAECSAKCRQGGCCCCCHRGQMQEERVSRQIKGGLQSLSRASAMFKQLRQDGK